MRVVLLAGTEEDLKALRHYIRRNFGAETWMATYRKLKDSIEVIRSFPDAGQSLSRSS